MKAKKGTSGEHAARNGTGPARVRAGSSFGLSIPGSDDSEIRGTLIVIEGADGSGRSTQVALLKDWLESQGFAVQTMGLRRSHLVARDIDDILANNIVTRTTLSLMYATDFFDQLENRILPALRAGFVVIADRYIYSLIARAVVRGINRRYLEGIYQLAIRPDLTFWLDVGPDTAFGRELLKAPAISYWESGRDLYLSTDLYESFIRYQRRIRREFSALSRRFGFVEVDGEKSIGVVNGRIRSRVASSLGIKNLRYRPSALAVRTPS